MGGESAGPYTGVTEPERLGSVKLAIELETTSTLAPFSGDYKMEGDPEYVLLYYPLNWISCIESRAIRAGTAARHSMPQSFRGSVHRAISG